jgi:SAM-dependent methyltransferase
MSIKSTNHDFYGQAYSGRNFLKVLLKQFCSYDQLSKTRRNVRVIRHLPQFKGVLSVLDFGFGHGTFLMRMPRRHRISGCELSQEAIRNVRRLCSLFRRNVSLYTPDEFVAASQAISFDLVCCSHVIEHVDDEKSLLKLFHSVLGPDGYLLLNVPVNEVWVDPKHARSYTVESTRELLTDTGFKVEDVLATDRWSAWILYHEYVAAVRFMFFFRVVRFLFSLLPVCVLDFLEKMLPQKYKPQQLLVLAKKA